MPNPPKMPRIPLTPYEEAYMHNAEKFTAGTFEWEGHKQNMRFA